MRRNGDEQPRSAIWLASASPRRHELLVRAGFTVRCAPSDIDDAGLVPSGFVPAGSSSPTPATWSVAMAWFKAARVLWNLRRDGSLADPTSPRRLVAADTVCDLDGRIVGKPADAGECAALLRAFAGRTHRVVTGVCVLDLERVDRRGRPARILVADVSTVTLGDLDERTIAEYVAGDRWIGKAGGYNYDERLDAGWPLRCDGDATSVTGLPMSRVLPFLKSIEKRPTREATSCP